MSSNARRGVGISNKLVTKLVRVKNGTRQKAVLQTETSEINRNLKISRYFKLGVVAFVLIGIGAGQLVGRVSSESRYIAPQARLDNPIQAPQAQTVDEVIAADVAAIVAEEADLLITPNVTNRADTLNAQVTTAATTEEVNTAVIEKPQLVAPSTKSADDIATIEVSEGQTLASLAAQYGVSEDTIRWANDLRSDRLTPGTKLVIPPVTGVLHTVAAGDTVDSLASTYQSNAEQIAAYNDLEIRGLAAGARVVIPGGVKPTVRAISRATAAISSPRSASFSWGGDSTVYAGNRYAYGYCTYYAFNKRAAAGRPIGSNWGNATTWAALASASGFAVNRTPSAGAVFQTSGGWGGYGHVGYVESVNPDGSILVSEMNYAGWNRVSSRTISADQVGMFNYIH